MQVDLRRRVTCEDDPALDHRSLASKIKDQAFARLEIQRHGLSSEVSGESRQTESWASRFAFTGGTPREEQSGRPVGLHGDVS